MQDLFQFSPRLVSGLASVAEFEIDALIQDNLDSIGCYQMNVTFPSLDQLFNETNTTVESLNQHIGNKSTTYFLRDTLLINCRKNRKV